MPIRLLLEDARDHFGPDEIRNLVEAFEAALTKLGLKDRKNPATMLVARAIIDVAKKGERDPIRLCQAAVEALSAQDTIPDKGLHTRA
jgi:hypothetical protein